jgi:hypothetical protein
MRVSEHEACRVSAAADSAARTSVGSEGTRSRGIHACPKNHNHRAATISTRETAHAMLRMRSTPVTIHSTDFHHGDNPNDF